jgi:hypothetical protein
MRKFLSTFASTLAVVVGVITLIVAACIVAYQLMEIFTPYPLVKGVALSTRLGYAAVGLVWIAFVISGLRVWIEEVKKP